MATEKRLIDANALMLKARWMEEPDGNGILCDVKAVSTIAIKNAPTVDAVEVVHGLWVDEFDGKYANPKYICSNCTLKALYKQKMDVLGNWQTVQALTDYCPNCGAKMDGDGNA